MWQKRKCCQAASEIALNSENQHAVLAVTHDPRTMKYADRILKIEDGRIVGEERSG